jgi:hypothetical protein
MHSWQSTHTLEKDSMALDRPAAPTTALMAMVSYQLPKETKYDVWWLPQVSTVGSFNTLYVKS